MNKLVMSLILLLSNAAMAQVSVCQPIGKKGALNNLVTKALLNTQDQTITVILKSSQAITGSLVDASSVGRGAMGFSQEDVYKTNLNVNVIPASDGKTYVLVSPFMSMEIPQQLLCK